MNKAYKYEDLLLSKIYNQKDIKKFYEKIRDGHNIVVYMSDKPIRKYNGKYKGYISNMCVGYDEDLQAYTNITDYYVDDVRFECSKLDLPNPVQQFYSDKEFDSKYEKLLEKYNIINPDTLIKKIFMRKMLTKYKNCDLHPIDNLLNIIKIFRPTKMLDMCAGWGDRLFASIIYGKTDYIGVDPNSKLAPRYEKIIDDFANSEHIYKVISEPFESCDLEQYISNGQLFDFMLSSPPYFISEKYSNEPTQALNYKTVDSWFKNFMYPSIDKIHSVLKDYGYMCMIINDTDIIVNNKRVRIELIDKIIDYSIKKNFRLMNIFKTDIRGSIQPLLVFIKKTKPR
jgi:tRNA1(Val) A37 N6-methylase TrmN6